MCLNVLQLVNLMLKNFQSVLHGKCSEGNFPKLIMRMKNETAEMKDKTDLQTILCDTSIFKLNEALTTCIQAFADFGSYLSTKVLRLVE